VRLGGPRRVEVYEPRKKPRTVLPGSLLTAPGVLQNPVRVEALYDRDEAERATLRNLLQRRGYEDLDAVLAKGRQEGHEEGLKEGLKEGHQEGLREGHQEGLKEGHQEGLREGHQEGLKEGRIAALFAVLEARGLRIGKAARERIAACSDAAQLDRWIRRAATIQKASELFSDGEV
jgi:predicted transposase YdaD